MALLSKTKYGKDWLNNFDSTDRKTASLLIDNLMLVSASEFTSRLNAQLISVADKAKSDNHPVAFYAEREVEKNGIEVKAYFPNTESGRASGEGVPPVTVDPKKQDVGSEGVVAATISKLCKSRPNTCLSHPGPDKLREEKVRKIVIVTDFIGSGFRLYDMLNAFEKVATIKSWSSYKLISFEVVCYSATEDGLKWVKSHPLKPSLHIHIACPTIDERFVGIELGAIKLLCKKYPKRSKFPFGFRQTGSLIAFSHGIPNNAPPILHSKAKGWKPLFFDRSTIEADIDAIADHASILETDSKKVLKVRNARKLLQDPESELWIHTVLIMDAINKGLRTKTKLSARTQITLLRVEEVLGLASNAKWLTPNNSLTALGRRELKFLKRRDFPEEVLVSNADKLYFPTQLRAL